ncbi:MAG: hypothetical protein ACP5HQ_05515 [Thermoprotei archaeon]
MEVMDKVTRTVLEFVAAKGPEGVEIEELYRGLSLLIDKDSISRALTYLMSRGYLNVLKDDGAVKLIAGRNVRVSLLALETQKAKLAAYLKRLASRKNELAALSPEKKAEEERRISLEIMALIGQSLAVLMRSTPELTVPEYLEAVEKLWSPLLSNLKVEIVPDEEIANEVVSLAKRLLGEKEGRVMEMLLKAKGATSGKAQGSEGNP